MYGENDETFKIMHAIETHIAVYKSYGIEVPPYRLTFQESIKLSKICSSHYKEMDKYGNVPISFMGCDLELVTKVEI